MAVNGHLFVINGEAETVACDGWMVASVSSTEAEAGFSFKDTELLPKKTVPGWDEGKVKYINLTKENYTSKELKLPEKSNTPYLVNVSPKENESPTVAFARGAVVFLEAFKGALEKNKKNSEVDDSKVRKKVKVFSPANRRYCPLVCVPLPSSTCTNLENLELFLLEVFKLMKAGLGFDVAITVANATEYAFVEALRRRMKIGLLWPSLGESLEQKKRILLLKEARRLTKLAKSNQLAFFMGAGVSFGAGLPSWGGLVNSLAEKAGLTDAEKKFVNSNFLEGASLLSQKIGKEEMNQFIAKSLVCKTHALQHSLIQQIPSAGFVTTNYDELFEMACFEANDPIVTIPAKRNFRPPESNKNKLRWLLKLHGDIEDPESIVLSREDYNGYEDHRSTLLSVVRTLLMTKHIVFIGFSLTDYNFFKIAHAVKTAQATEGKNKQSKHFIASAFNLIREPPKEELWKEQIKMVNMLDPPTDGSPIWKLYAPAGRQLEIMLDYIGCYAGARFSTHLLDPRFKSVLEQEDQAFCTFLVDLIKGFPNSSKKTEAYYTLSKYAESLGHPSGDDCSPSNSRRHSVKDLTPAIEEEPVLKNESTREMTASNSSINSENDEKNSPTRTHRGSRSRSSKRDSKGFLRRIRKFVSPRKNRRKRSRSPVSRARFHRLNSLDIQRLSSLETESPDGHVFVVNADIRPLACDVVLFPSATSHGHQLSWYWTKCLTKREINDVTLPFYGTSKEGIKLMEFADTSQVFGSEAIALTDLKLNKKRQRELFVSHIGSYPEHKGLAFIGRSNTYELQHSIDKEMVLTCVVQQYLHHAHRLLKKFKRKPLNGREKFLVALPLIGLGHAGGSRVTGRVLLAILPCLQKAADAYEIDIVLSCWDKVSYTMAQRYRMSSCLTRWSATIKDEDFRLARRLAVTMQKGDLALFYGSHHDSSLGRNVRQLLLTLAKSCEIDGNLLNESQIQELSMLRTPDLAKMLEKKFENRRKFIKAFIAVCKEARNIKQISLYYQLLGQMQFREIVTDEVHDLLVDAFSDIKKDISQLQKSPKDNAWILYLNGCVSDGSIAITRERAKGTRHHTLQSVMEALLVTKHILYVGITPESTVFQASIQKARHFRRKGMKLATLLTAVSNSMIRNSYVNVVCTADEKDEKAYQRPSAEAARQLEIFLDLLGALVSNCNLCLLDPRFDGVISEEEEIFKKHIKEALCSMPNLAINSTHFKRFLLFLHTEFGLSHDTIICKKRTYLELLSKHDLALGAKIRAGTKPTPFKDSTR